MTSKYPRRMFLAQLATLGVAATTVSQYATAAARDAGETAPRGDKKFVPVMITPFTSDLKIDYKGLSALIDLYLSSGARGLFANCLSSEMYKLSEEERLS